MHSLFESLPAFNLNAEAEARPLSVWKLADAGAALAWLAAHPPLTAD